MKRALRTVPMFLLLTALAAGVYVYFLGGEIPYVSDCLGGKEERSPAGIDAAEENGNSFRDVVQKVKTAPVRNGVVEVPRVFYGTVVPGKGSLITVSSPYECKILHILVRAGQEVAGGDVIVEIGPSEDSRLALEQARNSHEMAKQELERVKERLTMKLATNEEAIRATENFRQAELHLESLLRKGVSKPLTIRAEKPGVVRAINAQEGAVIALGAPLLDIAGLDILEARLGAEPGMAPLPAEGDAPQIEIASIDKTAGVKVKCPIQGIGRTVDPTSHLVDVFATLPGGTGLLLGQPVTGTYSLHSKEALIIPRAAALPEGERYAVFMVKGGHAHKLAVDLGLENDEDAEVLSPDLHEGDSVVILGNYELKDGMAVMTDGAQ